LAALPSRPCRRRPAAPSLSGCAASTLTRRRGVFCGRGHPQRWNTFFFTYSNMIFLITWTTQIQTIYTLRPKKITCRNKSKHVFIQISSLEVDFFFSTNGGSIYVNHAHKSMSMLICMMKPTTIVSLTRHS
jgi:hypothetical protein